MKLETVLMAMQKTAAQPTVAMNTLPRFQSAPKPLPRYKGPNTGPEALNSAVKAPVKPSSVPAAAPKPVSQVSAPAKPVVAPKAVSAPANAYPYDLGSYAPYAPAPEVSQMIAMQETLNGKVRQGDWDKKLNMYRSGGLYQMRGAPDKSGTMVYPVIQDVNSAYGTNFTGADVWNDEKATEIMNRWLARYGKNFHKRTGRMPSTDDYLRMWNGGPSGYMKDATLAYAQQANAKWSNPGAYGLKPGVYVNQNFVPR